MANANRNKNRHIVLQNVTETQRFCPPTGGGISPDIPELNRDKHAAALRKQLNIVRIEGESAVDTQRAAGMKEGLGLSVEFKSFPGVTLLFERLARDNQGIQLLNVRHHENVTQATVFLPEGEFNHFEARIARYLNRRDVQGRHHDHRVLLDAIKEIRKAGLDELWTDDPEAFPSVEDKPVWWEVWLPVRANRPAAIAAFRERAEIHDMILAQGELHFPERTVVMACASVDQMRASLVTLGTIAELRKPRETADFFDSMTGPEQREWLDELLDRTQYASDSDEVPHVCLLDTGVNRGHRLLAPALAEADLHTVHAEWGTADFGGHGTRMAGLALAGNLTDLLTSSLPINIGHRLESVKLLPGSGNAGNDPDHHGYLTVQAVARPERSAPDRRRLFGMAVTAKANRDRGRPSAWSSAIDALAVGAIEKGRNPRLLVVSAGNSSGSVAWNSYPESNDSDGMHDPSQAWNALTIGAYTDLTSISEPDAQDLEAVAPKGGLSPFSTTSVTWERYWPLKPDVVMEGGNAASSKGFTGTVSSLSLLTTASSPTERSFTTIEATSAATALACQFGAQVMAMYPNCWPETIRGLIVHSAEWTETMKSTYLPKKPLKDDYQRLLRRCGFGVPRIQLALWSAANSLTMIVQQSMVPFEKPKSRRARSREMQIHRLPWPTEILEGLGEVSVEMRVTLSYFIEPNPSRRGVRSPYRYESHGFRFDVKRPHETTNEFCNRLNAATRDANYSTASGGSDSSWLIGTQGRHRGSIHGDIWRGNAIDLASRKVIAVYPTTGWWKTRRALERHHQEARYSLIVNICTPDVDVDLYTAVANQIELQLSA